MTEQDNSIQFTRQDRMTGKCTHREYYAQFVTEAHIQNVAKFVGHDRLLNSQDEHLNDIPLYVWDRLAMFQVGYMRKWTAAGNKSISQSDLVCISKEAAKQYIERRTEG